MARDSVCYSVVRQLEAVGIGWIQAGRTNGLRILSSFKGGVVSVVREPSIGPTSRLLLATKDLVDAAAEWRIFIILAGLEVRQRYRRSSIGQFWITLSMAAQIIGIGLVFSVIFKQPIGQYLPYLGAGFVLWGFISGLVNDSTTAFISSELYLKSYPGPRSVAVYRCLVRCWIVLFHNLIICFCLILLFRVPITFGILLFLPAVVLVSLNAVWIGLLLGTLSARFRDLPLIVSNIMQLAFFLTPVMYRPQQVSEELWIVSHLNPFASWMQIMRSPLLGVAPDAYHWAFSVFTTILGFLIAIPIFARFRARIVYWI